jgi:hypothetical protein
MKLMTLPQYLKMSKPALIRKITKALRAMPKAKLARLCYNITKSKLPRLRKIKRKGITYKKMSTGRSDKPYYWLGSDTEKKLKKRKTKRKFSHKQLAAQRLFAKRARAGTLRKRRR